MSQVSVSQPPTGLSFCSHKSGGINLPQIQHPLSRLDDPAKLDIRGTSRAGGRPASQVSLGGRPLPNEGVGTPQRSTSHSRRSSKLSRSAPAAPLYECIPEGVEVTQGDAGTTRLPIFGSLAGSGYGEGHTSREAVQQRVSSRLSLASVQARLEMDELEMLLRDKVKNNFYDVKSRFISNDPEQKGNVSREALNRIIFTIIGRPLSVSLYNRLLDRLGLRDCVALNYTDFFTCFRDPEIMEWMDPVQRHQDKATMTSSQVYVQLKDKAKQRSLDLRSLVPQSGADGLGYVMKHEFRNVLEVNALGMEDEEFDKLWAKFDTSDSMCVKAETLMSKLGIQPTRAPSGGKLSPIDREVPGTGRSNKSSKRSTPLRKREQERLMSLDVEKWLKNKFREGFWSLKEKMETKDVEKKGLINHMDFLEILAENGLSLERSYLHTFLARCSLPIDKRGVPYIEFLQKFQDRSEAGFPHKILTDPNHRYNNRVDSATYSTMSAVESQLMNMFQREFLALLGTFHTIDKIRMNVISQEEFRAAIESRFGLEITDDQFRAFIDKVPLTDDGLVKYAQFMAQFDSRGAAKSLYEPADNHVPVDTRTPPSPPRSHGDVIEEPEQPDSATRRVTVEPNHLIIHDDELVEEFPEHRSTDDLTNMIKDLVKRRYADVEREFYDIDDVNSGQLSQETMYQLLKRFDIEPEVSRGEIRDLWKTFIVSRHRTLFFHEFARHFGYSLKSAAFPNAKVCPPRRGDADCMQTSKKLNSSSVLITDNIRAKIDYLFDDLRQELADMDPYNTGFVSIEEFKDILTELNIRVADWEMNSIAKKFDLRQDGRISYIDFMRPFALRRRLVQPEVSDQNLLDLLSQPPAQANVSHMGGTPQAGLSGILVKLRQLCGDWKTLRRAFKKLDSDNTGYLSLPEFRSVLKLADITLSEDEIYHLMTEFDKELSGNIQYTKFLRSTFREMRGRSSIG